MEQIRDIVIRASSGIARQERIEAYGRLVEAFRDMAVGYAYSILADFHLAEDAAQEAFIAAFEKLGQLERPEAFPGWFRQIVWSACTGMVRRKAVPTASIDAAATLASPAADPGTEAERTEMRDEVLRAISQLPAEHREVTTLFYINGYSQNDIADFLEVPVGTVKSRLTASRGRLKERMLNMVEQTLHNNAPDKRFDRKVIDGLLSRPRPLEITDHPVKKTYEALRQAVPGYQVIEGDEFVAEASIANPWFVQFAFQAEKDRVLRPETTLVTFGALAGRTPPVHLIAAGRVFRNHVEDDKHTQVLHQFDLVCLERGANEAGMKTVVQSLIAAVLGDVELRYEKTSLPALDPCYKVEAFYKGAWRGVCGCGVFKKEFLEKAGHRAGDITGFAVATELENLAMLKFGIDDIRKLWQPPYIH